MKDYLHLIILPVFPYLFLYANNIHAFPIRALVFPLTFVLSFTAILAVVLTKIWPNNQKVGLVLSVSLFLFGSYGYLTDSFGGHLYLDLSILLFLLIGFMFYVHGILFFVRSPKRLIAFLNSFAIVLLFVFMISVVNHFIDRLSSFNYRPSLAQAEKPAVLGARAGVLPDIYYIILDGYAREDVFQKIYQSPNGEFINHLEEQGFYVADRSSTNYIRTDLSLASSLNIQYIQNIVSVDNLSNDVTPLRDLIRENYVISEFQKLGYKFINVSSGFYTTNMKDKGMLIGKNIRLNEFENTAINLTPIPILMTIFANSNDLRYTSIHRNAILEAFEKVMFVPEEESPAFVFAHIVAPHPPFVFDSQGRAVDYPDSFSTWDGSHLRERGVSEEEYLKSYSQQSKFVSNRMTEIVSKILQATGGQAIIILQSDHGPGLMLDWENIENTNLLERFSILNAYYFPDREYGALYESITPVNTFRVVFNKYFGGDFELLEDKSYFSRYTRPYEFVDITESLLQE